jgi:hypothetical protein
MRYDPEKPPAPDVWRDLDEDEAQLMIARHHRSPGCAHPPAANRRLHDITHLLVENHAASPDLPIADALVRLVAEGLTRHEAVHAVGSVMSRYLLDALSPGTPAPDLEQYYTEVRSLTAASWRHGAESGAEPANPFRLFDDEELIALLFTQEDRLPRAAVDEIVARGSRLLGSLIAIVIDSRNWAAPLPDWWAPVHATFILAAIPDPTCDAPLLSAMRDAEARGNDWISGAMPAILGARGARLRATLMRILDNRTEPAGVRCTALDGFAATTLVDPEGRDEVFGRIGDLLATTTEDRWVRERAGQVLLDFQVQAYEQALLDFAGEAEAILDAEHARGITGALAFDVADVLNAFREPQDLSRYQEPWLDFYDDDAIAARQRRWQREAEERAARQRRERTQPKVGRNEPCPCGSGRKYKKCCLAV